MGPKMGSAFLCVNANKLALPILDPTCKGRGGDERPKPKVGRTMRTHSTKIDRRCNHPARSLGGVNVMNSHRDALPCAGVQVANANGRYSGILNVNYSI